MRSSRTAGGLSLPNGRIISAEHRFQGSHAQCRRLVSEAVVNLLGLASSLHQIGASQLGKLLAERRLAHASGSLDVSDLPLTAEKI